LDPEEEVVTAHASPEELIGKLQFFTMYLSEKQFMYLFCFMSAFS